MIVGTIDDYKSTVFLCFYRGGDWTRYKQTPRANSVNLINKHSNKLGTLIRSTRADRPAPGLDCPTAHFGAQQTTGSELPFG
jgi:hypothetical protein